jgi:hypothetical protein
VRERWERVGLVERWIGVERRVEGAFFLFVFRFYNHSNLGTGFLVVQTASSRSAPRRSRSRRVYSMWA